MPVRKQESRILSPAPDWSKPRGLYGGRLKDVPKPHVRFFPDKVGIRREVRVRIGVFSGIGKHFHVDLTEEGNPVWDVRPDRPFNREAGHWRECWSYTDPEGQGKVLMDKFGTEAEVKRWIEEMREKYFPAKTHKLVNCSTGRRWYYRDGD